MCSECGHQDDYIPEVQPDPYFDALLRPWEEWGPPAKAVGAWHEFSPHALEAEIIRYIDRIARHLVKTRSDLVFIETGVGQGYTTRQLVHHLRPDHDLYWAYESDHEWREALSLKDFWLVNLSACLKIYPMPEPREVAIADLMIIHSQKPWNYSEFHLWEATAKPDSILVFTGTLPPETQVPSLTLGNPKGTHVLSWDIARVSQIWSNLFERKWAAQ